MEREDMKIDTPEQNEERLIVIKAQLKSLYTDTKGISDKIDKLRKKLLKKNLEVYELQKEQYLRSKKITVCEPKLKKERKEKKNVKVKKLKPVSEDIKNIINNMDKSSSNKIEKLLNEVGFKTI